MPKYKRGPIANTIDDLLSEWVNSNDGDILISKLSALPHAYYYLGDTAYSSLGSAIFMWANNNLTPEKHAILWELVDKADPRIQDAWIQMRHGIGRFLDG